MHIIQQKILALAQKADIGKIGLRRLGKEIGEPHPQKIKHHLEQLEKKGYLYVDKRSGSLKTTGSARFSTSGLLRIPIVGSANCGPAEIYADGNIEGYLSVSTGVVGRSDSSGLYAIRAVGDSMDRAKSIEGGPIENGDYVVIDSERRDPANGDYVLSIIEDHANIKRFYHDKANSQIMLVSESALDIPPVYIHARDKSSYYIGGAVIKVIKKPPAS